MQRVCARCRGGSPGDAQFCRFCGASLADAGVGRVNVASAPAPQIAPRPAHPMTVKTTPQSPFARARLVLIARDGGEGPSYPLDALEQRGATVDIGRSEGNIVVGDDPFISPRHARIARLDGAGRDFVLRDLGSTNGVFVRIPFGGAEKAEQAVTDQDLFLLGQQVLRFEVVKHADEGFGVASENGTQLFGTPASPRYARLSQRTVEGVVRDVFHVRKAETIIGRESGDIVFTDDPFLSRRHAALRVDTTQQSRQGGPEAGNPAVARRFTLADLGSSNGTFVQMRAEVRLRHGDHFRIGQQLFRFDLQN